MWVAIILLGSFTLYALYSLEKKIDKVTEERGLGYSYSFSVDLTGAIYEHPKFLKDSKIKSAIEGIPYKNWTGKEKDSYADFINKVAKNKGWVYITYLTSENGFLVRDGSGHSGFIFRGLGSTNILNETVLGEEYGIFNDHLNVGLTLKIEQDADGKYRDFLIGYIEESFKDMKKKSEAKVLFKFPYNSLDLPEDYYKRLGFDVKHEGGDDIYTDSLGETQSIPTVSTFKQNGAEVRIVS